MRRRRLLCVALSCLGGPPLARGAIDAGPTPAMVRSVARWVADLDAADPAVRDGATDALANTAGPPARAAVVAALPAASPEAAARLEAVLLRTVPWDVGAGADPAVRLAFAGYAGLGADDRANRIAALPGQGAGAVDGLVRVLSDDPSPAVRWAAANGLRLGFDPPTDGPSTPATAAAAAAVSARVLDLTAAPADPSAYPPASRNGPLLAAAAWACRATDPGRADELMGRALALESARPSAFRGQADFAYLWAADRAADRNDFAAAVALSRQLAARTPWSDVELPEAVADLFALQAEHGPTAGFDDDLRLYRPYLARPEVLYCLGRLAARQGGPAGLAAGAALDGAALVAGGTSVDVHCAVGLFLFRHGWTAAAERELQGSLWLAGPDASPEVYFALHAVANDCDDDAAAGRYLEAALRHSPPGAMVRVTRYGQTIPWSEADRWAEVHWHYLRAAATAGDRPAALAQARQLLDLDADGQVLQHDPGMAADVVPVLVDAGRVAEADRCFDAAHAALAALVAAGPAEPMPKNNLAWLCARSDRHLDEADRLSSDAVRLEPGDAACLDTRAEVLVRLGRPREAVELEGRALSVKPQDVYMQRQLARFRAAVKPAG